MVADLRNHLVIQEAGNQDSGLFRAPTGGIFVNSQLPTRAFIGTNPVGELITSGMPVIAINWPNEPARFLLRVHPSVRPRYLDGHIRKENSRRLAVRRSAVVRREEQRASLLVARPGGCDVARWFGSAAMIDELHDSPIRPDVKIPSVSRRVATNLRRIFHRDKLRRTLSDRQFLVVLLH